jgi:hypothetical protein
VVKHSGVNFLIPLSWCLFQSIQTFLQPAHKMLLAFDPLWFLHINFFFQVTMKKCSLHIKLFNLEVQAEAASALYLTTLWQIDTSS